MKWETKISTIVLAHAATRLEFEVEELVDLEKTIDDLFAELERDGDPTLLEELAPYFGCVWPSAIGLSEYLLANPVEQNGAVSVLEVGCGLAIPSFALAKSVRLSRVVASDFHPEVATFFSRNLARNELPSERLEYRALDWRSPPDGMEKYGVVIGSDVLYEKTHPGDLADALVALAKPGGRIVIADPARPYLQPFVDEMRARGFGAEPEIVTVPSRDIVILDFKRI